jgi:ubiquinone/menaquinone biosynthesis C-methylase UbiE
LVYQDPFDRGPLVNEHEGLLNPRTGALYAFRRGIPVFLPLEIVEGPNQRYQRLYDRIAPLYDVSTRLYARLKSGAEEKRRRTYLQWLEPRTGANLLEVSVGTGANWPFLPKDLMFHGLDLSWNMLARCQRHALRLGLHAELCQGLAEHLPYPDNWFDCVFHVGGINFFSDQKAALSEMVRVARPGTRLVVVDETEELAQRHENKIFARAFFKNRPRRIEIPTLLLPPGMQEIRAETICDNELYLLTFRKPA